MSLLEYFTCRQWTWSTDNIRQLLSDMSPQDRRVTTSLCLSVCLSVCLRLSLSVFTRGATTSSKLGVQFFGLGYYYPSTEKIDRSTQFGAVGYIITLCSSKSYVRSWGSVKILGRSGPPTPLNHPVVVPMLTLCLSVCLRLLCTMQLTCNVHGHNYWGSGVRTPKFGRTPKFSRSILMNRV